MNISDYSYYRLYREAEARMERELELRRIAREQADPGEPRRLIRRALDWARAPFRRAPRRVAHRAGSTS
ncbi:hypothetical protein [Agreia sp.]|uniref:hypothetical protein n=1 Tax=Agreia sp. TaxID=1872416 RepID=UPI0035BC1E4B